MANTKEYYIKINGLTESVSAVESLNKQLDALEKRIKAIDASSVKVSTGGGGNSSAMSQEAAVQKEINKLKAEGERLDAKIAASQDEIYKRVDATKQLYKETIADQKAIAAQERLTADAYSNTMQGMKNHLADLKAAINVTDLGDSDKIKKMTKEANELTNKLKQMEEAYGQFGRNVGNYPGGEGFKGLAIQVGDVTKEFESAKQAYKELNGEMKTLNVKKDLGLISEEESQRLKDLIPVVAQLESGIKDAGKPMDAIMDTMQSIVALAQTTKGLSAFLGLDSDAIERSIQKLVALQNAMQGLQTIQNQLKSGEFLGGWLSKASSAFDTFAAKITKTDKAAKALSLTLKGLTGLALVGVIIAITKALYDLNKQQKDVQKSTEEGLKAYAKAETEITVLQTKLDKFNGTKEQEKKLVDSLNSKYGNSIGQYKSLAEWKDALVKKGKVYCQILQKEAEMQAIMNLYTENFIKLQKARKAQEEGNQDTVDLILKALDGEVSIRRVLASIRDDLKAPFTDDLNEYNDELGREVDELEKNGDELKSAAEKIQTEISELSSQYGLMDNAPQIEKNGKKTKKAVEDVQRTLTDLEMRLMKEGLNKKLKQLNEEERQTINKLQENGKKTAEVIQQIQRKYAALRAKEIQEYLKNIQENLKKSAQDMEKIKFDIDTKTLEQNLTALENKVEDWKTNFEAFDFQPLTSNSDLKKQAEEERKTYKEKVNQLRDSFESQYNITREFIGKIIDDETAFMQDEKALNEERIREQEKANRRAEQDRFTIQMSGLSATSLSIKDGLRAIENQYKVHGLEGIEILKDSNVKEEREVYKHYHELFAAQVENEAQILTAKQQHETRLKQISKDANNEIKKNEIDSLKDIAAAQERYFNQQVTNYRDLVSKINNELNKSPIFNKNTGIVDKEATRKQYLELINAAESAFKKIAQDKADLDKKFKEGVITEEVKNATERNLDELEKTITEGYQEVLERNVNVTGDYLKSLEMYLQAAAEIVSTIMGGIFEAINNGFDREQEELDREYEQMQDELDKRRDAIKDYSDEINNIEDELSTARGSRRQHLIDQLNAEMELQREAAKERQRLDKEEQKNKEQMQKKQDALDKKRRKAQWYQDLAQAVVNGAMAVTYAAMNTWPIPAIPMMQLAAATSAVQLGVIAANHPFEKGGQLEGGVAQGPRHRDGGIPVLGGRASIEGGEFITNRQTTAKNVDLLDYINSKHKKLNLDDFIDFYSSGKVKKSISSMSPRLKFADGGVIPSLRTDIDINDRLMTAFEDYSDRPVVVSVQDINSRQAAVRNVQVLAGLNPE